MIGIGSYLPLRGVSWGGFGDLGPPVPKGAPKKKKRKERKVKEKERKKEGKKGKRKKKI